MKPSDTNDERNDPVWELLNSARKTEVSPVFVQNTVRKARQLDADKISSISIWAGFLNLLRRPAFALPLVAAAVVTVAMVINTAPPEATADGDLAMNGQDQADTGTNPVKSPSATPVSATVEFSFTDQVEEIDNLGDLVVVTDPSSLNEQMLAELFY